MGSEGPHEDIVPTTRYWQAPLFHSGMFHSGTGTGATHIVTCYVGSKVACRNAQCRPAPWLRRGPGPGILV
jgi:hypothetical protein